MIIFHLESKRVILLRNIQLKNKKKIKPLLEVLKATLFVGVIFIYV